MTQELIDLRTSILEGRYEDALAIVEDLEGMSRQAILRNRVHLTFASGTYHRLVSMITLGLGCI
ncbi:MAG: hypothetical protein EBE86_016975 [Hormoscilla sp. GUM202]|nr:hypothetical protein [Hormoscilla sp. GUM202]